jgi:predicted phosphodiesterase
VVYGTGDDLTREAYNAEHGLLPIGVHHAVRISGLEPGKTYRYRAVSTRVVKMKSYWPEKGLPVESPVYSFTTFDRNKPSFSFSLITDTHADVARINALTKRVDFQANDFLVHLGDAFDGVEGEEAIYSKFLDPVFSGLAHVKPLIHARGNHDTRGPGARALAESLPLPDGRFYFSRDHGPVHFIVLDTGEDKDDNTNVYAGLNRFKAYREEEFAWFEQHVRTDPRVASAPFRVLLMHAPNWNWVDGQQAKWTELANKAGIDLAISGHTHRFAHNTPGQNGKNYHELVIGPENVARVDASGNELKVVITNRDGAVVQSFAVPKRSR